jgi:hypothetical protein
MPIAKITGAQIDFSAGELDESVKRAHDSIQKIGARQMTNWRILSSKLLQNRPGRMALFSATGRVEEVAMPGGTVFFLNFSRAQLQVFDATGMQVFSTLTLLLTPGGTPVGIPWRPETIGGIVWAQIGKKIYIAYPDAAPNNVPQVLSWDGVSTWTLAPYVETAQPSGQKRTPFYRISPPNVTLLPSATTGNINITFSSAILTAGMVGTRLQFCGRQLTITGVSTPTTGTATVNEQLPPGQTLTYATLTGTINVGDLVTGSFSSAQGIVTAAGAQQTLRFDRGGGYFSPGHVGDSISGGTSSTTGIIIGQNYYFDGSTYFLWDTVSITAGTGFVVGETVTGPGGAGNVNFVTPLNSLSITVQLIPNTSNIIKNFVATGGGITENVVGPSGNFSCTAVSTTTPQAVADWDDEVMNLFRGYPSSIFADQSRLGFTNFPSVPAGIAWSALGLPLDLFVGAFPDDAIFELAPDNSQVFYVVPGMESSEFVFTDRAIYYIPIGGIVAKPLEPGTVAFVKLSDFGSMPLIQPRRAEQTVVYIKAGGVTVGAVQAPGAYYRPYVIDNISEIHTHLFVGLTPVAIAIPSGPTQFAELYIYIAMSNGTVVTGRYVMRQGLLEPGPEGKPAIGWLPWNSIAQVTWVAARQGDVIFTTVYNAETFQETIATNGSTYSGYTFPTFPHGIFDPVSNKTFFTWEGAIAPQGQRAVYVRAFNHNLSPPLWEQQYFVVNQPLINDDHGNPSICIDNLGYLHIFHGPHAGGTNIRHVKSNNPRDASTWTVQPQITATATYPAPVVVGNKIYLWHRSGTGNDIDAAMLSYFLGTVGALGVVSWGGLVQISHFGFTSRTYFGFPTLLNNTEIHIILLRSESWNIWRRDLFYVIYDTATGQLRNVNSTYTVPNLPAYYFQLFRNMLVCSQLSYNGTGVSLSVVHDAAGRHHVLFTDGKTPTNASEQQAIYYLATGLTDPTLPTSYSNVFSTGDRQTKIWMLSSISFLNGPYANGLLSIVDGGYVSTSGFSAAVGSGNIVFDFGIGRTLIVDAIKWYQSAAASQGTWSILASSTPSGAVGVRMDSVGITTNATFLSGPPPAAFGIAATALYMLVDGYRGDDPGQFASYQGLVLTGGQTGIFFLFDFGLGVTKIINGFTWWQGAAATQGTWSFEGSNDAISWTTITTGINLGGAAAQDVHSFVNVTAYRYYHLIQTAGTTNVSPFIYEIEFSIGDGSNTPSYDPAFNYVTLTTGINLGSVTPQENTFTNTTGYRYYKMLMTAGTTVTTATAFIQEVEFRASFQPGPVWSAPLQIGTMPNHNTDWLMDNALDGGIDAYGDQDPFGSNVVGANTIVVRHRAPGSLTHWESPIILANANRFPLALSTQIPHANSQFRVAWTEVGVTSNDSDPANGVAVITGFGGLIPNSIVERLDDTQYLDGTIFVNNLPAPFVPAGGFGKGPLYVYPGPFSTVFVIDLGTRFMGLYSVDGNGFLVPQNLGGENLTSPQLMAGRTWTAILEPFTPEAQPGQSVHQRMMKRRISRMAVYTSNATGYVMARLFSGPLTPSSPALGSIMNIHRVPTWNVGEDATRPPPLREEAQRWRPIGRAFDPRVAVIKDTPGPLMINEFGIEVTV